MALPWNHQNPRPSFLPTFWTSSYSLRPSGTTVLGWPPFSPPGMFLRAQDLQSPAAGTSARMSLNCLKLHLSPNELSIIPANLHLRLEWRETGYLSSASFCPNCPFSLGSPPPPQSSLENVCHPLPLPSFKNAKQCHQTNEASPTTHSVDC